MILWTCPLEYWQAEGLELNLRDSWLGCEGGSIWNQRQDLNCFAIDCAHDLHSRLFANDNLWLSVA